MIITAVLATPSQQIEMRMSPRQRLNTHNDSNWKYLMLFQIKRKLKLLWNTGLHDVYRDNNNHMSYAL